jgi:Tfp pilus assembly protein PilV
MIRTRGKTRIAGKNLLFAELIVVILFFSVAAAGCVTLFAEAFRDESHSRDLTDAVIMAQNTAEIFKATGEIHHHAMAENDLWQSSELTEHEGHSELRITVLREEEVIFELVAVKPKGVAS